MAFVKSFRINPSYGPPDKDIKAWIDLYEFEYQMVVNVTVLYIPGVEPHGNFRGADPRMTVILTKLDDARVETQPVIEFNNDNRNPRSATGT